MAFLPRIVLLVAVIGTVEAPPVTAPCEEGEMLCHGSICQPLETSEYHCDLVCDCEVSYDYNFRRHVIPCADEKDCLPDVIIEEITLGPQIDTVQKEETYVVAIVTPVVVVIVLVACVGVYVRFNVVGRLRTVWDSALC